MNDNSLNCFHMYHYHDLLINHHPCNAQCILSWFLLSNSVSDDFVRNAWLWFNHIFDLDI